MKMIDALYPDSIPAGTTCDAIAAYIDHNANPQSFQQAQTRFPNALHVKISASTPGTVGADVLDVEPGTYITPQHAVAWVVKSRAAGLDPTVYCNQLDPSWGWPAVRAAFAAAKVPEPHYWVANYDGDPTIPGGVLGKQYTDLDQNGRNTYDTSNMTAIPGHLEDYMPTAQEIAQAVLAAKVSTDTGTLDQTVRDARQIARRAEVAADQALTQLTALAEAVAKLQASVDALTPAQGTAGSDTTKGVQ